MGKTRAQVAASRKTSPPAKHVPVQGDADEQSMRAHVAKPTIGPDRSAVLKKPAKYPPHVKRS